jgi:hypothetical protein
MPSIRLGTWDPYRQLEIGVDDNMIWDVTEDRLRHGHCLIAHNDGRVLSARSFERDRNAALQLGPIHADTKAVLDILLGRYEPVPNAAAVVQDREDNENNLVDNP